MKKQISLILSFTLSLSLLFCVPVNATINGDDGGFLQNTVDWMKRISEIGMLMEWPSYPTLEEYMQQYKTNNPSSSIPVGGSEQDFVNWNNNGTIINGDNVTYNGDVYGFMKYFINTSKSAYSYEIAYPYIITDAINASYNAGNSTPSAKVANYQDGYNILTKYTSTLSGKNAYTTYLQTPKSNVYGIGVNGSCVLYNTLTGTNKFNMKWFPYYNDSNPYTGEQTIDNCLYSTVSGNRLNTISNVYTYGNVSGRGSFYVFRNSSSMTNDNLPKYFVKDSLNSNLTKDSYNTTTTAINNTLTYGDITTYINNNTDSDGNRPSPVEVNVYIDNYIPDITPTPTPTPGPSTDTNNGGNASATANANNSGVNVTVNNNHNISFNVPGLSGNGIGSGTVSGNGNGSGNIFDWISDIGGVIGEFIKNVGSLIADTIKGITETITTILADIPNIISVLVEFVYGGLPDELKAIVTLGITTVIFVGVIKMMRK